MDIKWQNGGITSRTSTGGRNGADLVKGGGWPAGIDGQYLVNNHTIDIKTGTGNRTNVSISCGFLHNHQIGAVLTRRDNRRCRIRRENTEFVVVGEQVASVLMFQRQGIELMVGDPQNDTITGSQLHINLTEFERFGVRYPVASRFEQVLLTLNRLQKLLGEDIPESLYNAIENFAMAWENPDLIRNGTTHDAFLELRRQYQAYDETYSIEEDLVAHLTSHADTEMTTLNTNQETKSNNSPSWSNQQISYPNNPSTVSNTSLKLPQAAKDAISHRAIEIVTNDLESREKSVTNVETASAAREHLGVDWPGYDLLVDQGSENEEHVEVKGTRVGVGGTVRLTRIEMECACTDQKATLAVVSSIICFENSSGEWIAEGGQLRYYRWVATDSIIEFLQPLDNGTLPGLSGVVGLKFPISPETSQLTERFVR